MNSVSPTTKLAKGKLVNKNKVSSIIIVLSALFIISSCSISKKGTIALTKPIRTIVDITSGEEGVLSEADKPNIIAIAQLDNDTSEPDAALVLRAVLQSQLSNKNFQLVHAKEVDVKSANTTLSPEDLAKSLGVDAILIGTVTEYEHLYAGIYAQIKLGLNVELISTEGKVLWHKEETITSRAGGVSTSPWGLLLNAALAALHLKDKNLFAAADELGRSISSEFPEPSGYIGATLPQIDMVIHDGSNKWLKYGDKISLAIKGEPGMHGLVDIEGVGVFDLTEQQPGLYHSDILVDKRWNGAQKVVVGKLVDNKGQISQKLSTLGLVNFDNQAPSNVTNLHVDFATTDEVKLSWDEITNDIVNYEISIAAAGNKQVLTTQNNSITFKGKYPSFSPLNISVAAIDRANNTGSSSRTTATVYPLKLTNATVLTNNISGNYSDVSILTKHNSPYVVSSTATFLPSSTLVIEPGVEVKFKPTASINVQGNAYFWGKQPISFNNESKRLATKKMLILDSEKTIELSGLVINKAGIGIEVLSGNPQFTDLTVTQTKYSAINIKGNANVNITTCTLADSSSSAVVIADRSRLSLSACTFKNNKPFHIQNASPFAVMAEQVTFDNSAVRAVLGTIEVKNNE